MNKRVVGLVISLILLSAGSAHAMSGEEVFSRTCRSCHVMGIGGAPRIGDKSAWAPRIAKGADALLQTVLTGKAPMPPLGGCISCSEEDLRAGVQYLINAAR